MSRRHVEQQREFHDAVYRDGGRKHTTTNDPFAQYIVRWRLHEATRRLLQDPRSGISLDSSVLIVCAGEGHEGTVLCDLGFRNVTVSDISDYGCQAAIARDPRLRAQAANAEQLPFDDGAFDLVVVQDGLHHLTNPVLGFTEMLRVGRRGAFFLEPHDSWIGNLIGTKWERHDAAVNYVFRWTRKLVQDITASYLVHDRFVNRSFAFWHHNPMYSKLGRSLGGGSAATSTIRVIKGVLDGVAGSFGNQFCGMVIKTEAREPAQGASGPAA